MGLWAAIKDLWNPGQTLLDHWHQTQQRDHDAHKPLPQLLRPVRRLFHSPISGSLKTAFKGEGMALKQIRPYEPGDNIRHMDWSVLARTGKAHVREYYQETQLPTWFIVDLNASMLTGQTMTKAAYAFSLVEWLALCAHQSGNEVGLLLWDGTMSLSILQPTRNLEALSTHIKGLETAVETTQRNWVVGRTKTIEDFPDLTPLIRRHANLHFVTDRPFFAGCASARSPLSRLAHKHHCLFWILQDPIDVSLDKQTGVLPLQDPNSSDSRPVWLNTQRPKIRQAFKQAASKQATQLMSDLQPFGEVCFVNTNQPVADALMNALGAAESPNSHGDMAS